MAHPGQPSDAVSAACPGSSPGVSSWWDMLETPPQGGCQGASDTDALATSAGSYVEEQRAALLRAPSW